MDDIEDEQLFPKHYLTISSVIITLSSLIGIIVNIIVIVVVTRAWRFHKKPVYVLVISGSVCGLLICLTLSPYEALIRLVSFRNLIASTPIGFVFCNGNFSRYMMAILNPISSWTNVSITYNRYAMCRFDLETYRRKFCRYRTFRWVRNIWLVPIIYGTIVIALTYTNVYSQDEGKIGTLLEGGIVNSTKSPLGNLSMPMLEHSDDIQETCTFGQLPSVKSIGAVIIVMAFTFLSNIIPNVFALFSMFYILRKVDVSDNETLVSWTKGTVTFLGIRAMLSLPSEIILLLRLPMFGISVPYFPYYLLRDLRLLLVTADPFIFGLRLPDFKALLLRQNNGQ